MREQGMADLPRTAAELARVIDHTLLSPSATATDIDRLCREAREHGLFSVCVNPCWVRRAAAMLDDEQQDRRDRKVAVCTVVGFPLGAATTLIKAAEAGQACADGADELDMVINLGWLLAGDHEPVRADIAAVVRAAAGRTVKVILETALLDDAQIRAASQLAVEAGAGFVKTSTGFGPGGATVAAVKAMRETVGPTIGVKASGGIRDAATARAMLEAGASRLGASASPAILAGWP
jgi:deoxyribose-phosphate aldolase